jgi:predicted ATPase/class 3 adenylate cyclase
MTGAGVLTFLIADVRGYTRFSADNGDEAAARLAGRFADIAEQVVGTHGGKVLELRGDEALAVFTSARSALRASVALQSAFKGATSDDASLPLKVGIGLDAGDAVPTKGGYRGGALNLAARLCSIAGAGDVLSSETVIALARKTDGLDFLDRGHVQLRGLPEPVKVIQVVPEGAAAAVAPPLTASLPTHTNLPLSASVFVGREREMREIVAILGREDVRLLTVTGPGGIGKTRLAIEVARKVGSGFSGGIHFVPLASLSDPRLVGSTVAAVLELKQTAEQPLARMLTDYLRGKDILLLLDNFEHLQPAAPFVSDLLAGCPGLKLLVTSRSPLHLAAEHEYPVQPLVLPDPGEVCDVEAISRYDAVALFVERARAVRPGFSLTAESATAVAEICSRLDGLPLAIELAAARIRLFRPEALLRRLSSSLALLTGGARDAPARHQTLRSAIDWSYALLPAEVARLFARLGVFAGGFSEEEAEGVCNASGEFDLLDGITSLVDNSLLQQEGSMPDSAGEPRFRMLETIREFAAEKLATSGEMAQLRAAHAAYFAGLAEQAEPELRRSKQKIWMDRLELEHDNVRSALDWTLQSGDRAVGLRLAAAFGLFWRDRGYLSEGRRWLEALLAGETGAGTAGRAKALDVAGMVARHQRDLGQARVWLEQSLSLAREVGDERRVAIVLTHLGGLARIQGELERATMLLEESLVLHRRVEDRDYMAATLAHLGEVRMRQGSYDEARMMFDEALSLVRDLGDSVSVGDFLVALGRVEHLRGDMFHAHTLYREGLALFRGIVVSPWIVEAIEGLAAVLLDWGDAAPAARLWGAAAAVREAIGLSVPAAGSIPDGPGTVRRSAPVAEAAWQAAWNEGRAVAPEGAADYVLAESVQVRLPDR